MESTDGVPSAVVDGVAPGKGTGHGSPMRSLAAQGDGQKLVQVAVETEGTGALRDDASPMESVFNATASAGDKAKKRRKKKKKKHRSLGVSRSATSLLRTGRGQKRQRTALPRSNLANLNREKVVPFPGGLREIKSSVGIQVVRADRSLPSRSRAGMKLSRSVPVLRGSKHGEPTFADVRDGMGGARVLEGSGKARSSLQTTNRTRVGAKRGLGASEGKVAWEPERESEVVEVKEDVETKADPFAARRKRLFKKSQSEAAQQLFAGLGIAEYPVIKPIGAFAKAQEKDSPTLENEKIHDKDFLRLDQSKMPLEKFDIDANKGEDLHELLRKSDTGRSPFWDGETWSWQPCRVLSYDPDSKRFAIEFSEVRIFVETFLLALKSRLLITSLIRFCRTKSENVRMSSVSILFSMQKIL